MSGGWKITSGGWKAAAGTAAGCAVWGGDTAGGDAAGGTAAEPDPLAAVA
jgi:hypothetical protein